MNANERTLRSAATDTHDVATDHVQRRQAADRPVVGEYGSTRGFASDNCSTIHPDVLTAIVAANDGHQAAYGYDEYTSRLEAKVRDHFGSEAQTYPVFNGTGANVVALRAMTTGWGAAVCASSAHVNLDECGAPERVAGVKLLPVPAVDGKLTPELIEREAYGFDDVHRAQPQVVSLAQATEYGTVYSPDELKALCSQAHAFGMTVHMDGARLANAAASLALPLRALTTDVGVDVVSFGGTKNGLLLGEAVIVIDPNAVTAVEYARKASTQLGSKLRFVSAQLQALLEDDLWLRNADHANTMARRLEAAVAGVTGLRISRPVQANAVFAVIPRDISDRLQARFQFSVWDESTSEVRWMTSFDTTERDVDDFARTICQEFVHAAAH